MNHNDVPYKHKRSSRHFLHVYFRVTLRLIYMKYLDYKLLHNKLQEELAHD